MSNTILHGPVGRRQVSLTAVIAARSEPSPPSPVCVTAKRRYIVAPNCATDSPKTPFVADSGTGTGPNDAALGSLGALRRKLLRISAPGASSAIVQVPASVHFSSSDSDRSNLQPSGNGKVKLTFLAATPLPLAM